MITARGTLILICRRRLETYMKWSLAIDVGAVDVDLVVVEQRDDVVDVGVIDGVEHDVVANLLDGAYHCLNNLNIIIKITRHIAKRIIIKRRFFGVRRLDRQLKPDITASRRRTVRVVHAASTVSNQGIEDLR